MTILTKGFNTGLKLTGVMVTLALLNACATTNTNIIAQSTPATNVPAKDALASAVKSQLYHSFGYDTRVYVSNEAHRQATETAEQAQPSLKHCENTHDDAYVALLKKAHQEKGKHVDVAKDYPQESKAIKSAYKACVADIEAERGAYQTFDFDGFYQQTQGASDEERSDYFLTESTTHVILQAGEHDAEDDKDPALELKKAKLLDTYLLKPSQLSISGRYHPLKGQFTALPSIQYDAKNLYLSVNQPMLVDIKAGGIYLWADNFALANSQFLDKRLGDKWHNKWLFLPFNDGSLPEGFAKDFAKAYLNAKKESFLALPNDSFVWTKADELAGVPYLSNNLPSTALSLMTNTPRIIKSEISAKDKSYQDYVFYDELYNAITKKYPELAMEQVFGDPHTVERDIIDGESVIAVRNAESKQEAPVSEMKMNAKMMMSIWLSSANMKAQIYAGGQTDVTQDEQKTPLVTYYGLQDNKLAWLSQRYHLDKQLKGGQFTKLGNEPMVVDVFTQIHQDPNKVQSFDSLPVPTEQNSVNLLTYKDEFLAHLKNSDDQYLQTILGLFLGQEEVSATPAEAKPAEDDTADEPAIALPEE